MADVFMMPVAEPRTLARGQWAGEEVRTLVWRGILRALEPMSPSSGSFGSNISELATEPVIGPGGEIHSDVPSISGVQMCSLVVRQPGMDYVIERLGLSGLPPQALDLLYSGGMLESPANRAKRGRKSDVGTYSVALFDDMVALIPLLGVLGGALGTSMEPSRIYSDTCLLVCSETAHLLPNGLLPDGIDIHDSYSYRSDRVHTRGDMKLRAHYRKLLMAEAGEAEELRLQDNAQKKPEEKEKSLLMPYERESVARGSLWYWSFRLERITNVEFGAFVTAIQKFLHAPYLGGRRHRGYGKVEFFRSSWLEVEPFTHTATDDEIARAILMYDTHLDERKDEIVEFLENRV